MSGVIKHRFVLISRWHLDCAITAAWQCIAEVRRWPEWWQNVSAVRVDNQGAPQTLPYTPRVGDAVWIDWKTRLGYGFRLHVATTRVLPPFELDGSVDGDLIGQGLWVLEPVDPDEPVEHQSGNGVVITYRWDLHLNRAWMRVAAPRLRPVFAWYHFAVMRTGARAMAQRIGCRLLHYRDYRFSPGATDPAHASNSPNEMRAPAWNEPLVLQPSLEPRGARRA